MVRAVPPVRSDLRGRPPTRTPTSTFAKVDTEAEQQLAGSLGIMSIPTLMIFRDGIQLFSQPGALPKSGARRSAPPGPGTRHGRGPQRARSVRRRLAARLIPPTFGAPFLPGASNATRRPRVSPRPPIGTRAGQQRCPAREVFGSASWGRRLSPRKVSPSPPPASIPHPPSRSREQRHPYEDRRHRHRLRRTDDGSRTRPFRFRRRVLRRRRPQDRPPRAGCRSRSSRTDSANSSRRASTPAGSRSASAPTRPSRDADVVFLCVPTPQDDDGSADLTLRERLPHGDRSPAEVGCGRGQQVDGAGRIVPRRRRRARPRRRPCRRRTPSSSGKARPSTTSSHPDRVVIGADDRRAAAMVAVAVPVADTEFIITDPASAETIKYAANGFLAMKISFINSVAAHVRTGRRRRRRRGRRHRERPPDRLPVPQARARVGAGVASRRTRGRSSASPATTATTSRSCAA